MSAPVGAFSVFPLAAAVPAPAGAFSVFPHCRSSVCSRRSAICISPLPQQCLLPQERYLFFPTATAVLAPAGAFSPPGPSPPRHPTPPPPPPLPFPAAPCHPGTPTSCFLHCRSSACSSRNLLYISPLPQQCLLQQEPYLYFPTATAVTAPAGAPSVFPHYRSSVRSRRSSLYFSLPQQCLLPQELSLFFHCRSSDCSRRSATCISSLPQ